MSQFINHASHHEYVCGLGNGAPLAQRDSRRHIHVFEQKIGNEAGREGVLVQFRVPRRVLALEVGSAGMTRQLMPPGGYPSFLIKRSADPVYAGRAEIPVLRVLLACPHNLYWTARKPGQQRCVNSEVGIVTPAECTA